VRRLWFAALLPLTIAMAADRRFTFHDVEGGRVELRENGKPVFVYNAGMQLAPGAPEDRRRCCYVFPAYTPAGVSQLDDFPKDHYHHRGLFWAWNVVEAEGRRYDPWTLRGPMRAQPGKELERKAGDTSAVLAYENTWAIGDKQHVRERVRMEAKPAQGKQRTIDFTIDLEAIGQPVTLKGAPDQNKGYGGFSARFAPRTGTRILTPEGEVTKDEDHNPHKWVAYEAVYNGKKAGLRIEIDDRKAAAPNEWCLRLYGFAGVNYPGTKAHVLEPGKPLTLRYRVVLYDLD